MRKTLATLLVALLAASCFVTLVSAQTSTPTSPPTSPPPLIVRWMRYQGAITQWGQESFNGSIIVNAKTANVPPPLFKPWVTVDAFWSNQPPFPPTKPTGGQYVFEHYTAKLVLLTSIRKQDDMILNATGLWNITKIKITTDFNQSGAPIKVVREVTPIVSRAAGQLHISTDWKKFTIEIDGANPLQGFELFMRTSTNRINPFSFGGAPLPTLSDLRQVMGSFRAMPGIGNYIPELDYNQDSKIDLGDLTTVAANM